MTCRGAALLHRETHEEEFGAVIKSLIGVWKLKTMWGCSLQPQEYMTGSFLFGLRAPSNQSQYKVLCPYGAQQKGVESADVRGLRTRVLEGQLGHSIQYYWALIRAASFGGTQ